MARRRPKGSSGKTTIWDEAFKAKKAADDAKKPTMTVEEMIDTACAGDAECNVECSTYDAASGARTRKMFILSTKDHVLTLSPAYNSKPNSLNVGVPDGLKAAKSNAFFRIKNSGFDRSNIKTHDTTITKAFDLWNGPFAEFQDDEAAKLQFLKLIGAQEEGSSYTRLSKKAQEAEFEEHMIEQVSRYENTEGFGMF